MGTLVFVFTGLASMIILSAIRKGGKNFKTNLIVAIICGITLGLLGTYKGCADGWLSTSIGRNGACSHHGGVKTYINIYGIISVIASAAVIAFPFLKKTKP